MLRLRKTPYQKGDLIGQHYEVLDLLGEGGFGVVYKVYSRELNEVFALKTFRDEYLNDDATRELFRREAQIWVEMERHPYLMRAYYVEEISHRLYIIMEYIDPGEAGLNSLEGYLHSQPPDLPQAIRWATQFCYGMEYAYSKGLRCHRDIKPSNIMIASEKIVKISDFGLAGTAHKAQVSARISRGEERNGAAVLSQTIPVGGTLTHMAPEQFTDSASCDQRSDIYSFGVVLYQMASGKLPFELAPSSMPMEKGRGQSEIMWKLHSEAPVPRLNSKLFPVIQHCLEKKPQRRYQGFGELRKDLEAILERSNDERITPPATEELRPWEWGLKGASLNDLGRFEEALICHNRALSNHPGRENATKTLTNKAIALRALNRLEEAIRSCDEALTLDPKYSPAWNTKGNALGKMQRFADALACYDTAIRLEPGNAQAWNNKASALRRLGRVEEALLCHDRALKLDSSNSTFWTTKGSTLSDLRRFGEAHLCFAKASELDPRDSAAWFNKALAEEKLGRTADAAHSYEQFIMINEATLRTQLEYAQKRLSELRGERSP
ncbi:MAG TPA: serine/threonine-protein kinase [Candidatus Dormibacteraeota bacterium]|nr:serine/threonine-protein kinase [Candidatus Dormibacteraeota bacterium]